MENHLQRHSIDDGTEFRKGHALFGTLNLGRANATIYRHSAADSALIDWVMVSAGWTRD
jgi:hypothetical protein